MKKVNVVLFVSIISIFFIMYLFQYEWRKGASKSEIENLYTQNNVCKDEWISIYGLSQNFLGKKAIEQFTIYKNDYGKLVSPKENLSLEQITAKYSETDAIFKYLEDEGIPYFYITNILSITDEEDLPIGVDDYSEENANILLNLLYENEIPVIDLRTKETIGNISKEDLFYYTDHHWSIESCFTAFQEIIRDIEKNMNWSLDEQGIYTTEESYRIDTKPNSFLGSYGIKVNQYYAGKDDFSILIPEFETEYIFEAYDSGQNLILEKRGDFQNAFMDADILEDEDYNNKYNAFNNNCSVENRIINLDADNNKKVLLISHSFGRPLAQYLSTCFGEVRIVDPQEGRFTGDYREYIEEYEPDIVLFFVEHEGEIIGKYNISIGDM